jgi:hypothetical protein
MSAMAAAWNPLVHEAKSFKGNLPGHRAVFKKQVSYLVELPGRLHDIGPEANVGPCSLLDPQALQALLGRDFEVCGEGGVELDEVIHGISLLAAPGKQIPGRTPWSKGPR